MKQGMIHTGTACVFALALQGCATSEKDAPPPDQAPAKTADSVAECDTVFYCPADPEEIRICRRQDQLQVQWQTPGIDAYQLSGRLGQTFSVSYSQTAQIIENTLSWQHLGIRYQAFHYLDESRPETLEEIGITLETGGQTRTISCNDNAVSRMARLHHAPEDRNNTAPGQAD